MTEFLSYVNINTWLIGQGKQDVILRFETTSRSENGCGKWHCLVWTRTLLQRHSLALAWRLDREMRRPLILHETGFTPWRILLPTLSTSILLICFWFDLVRVLAKTGNTSGSQAMPRFQRNYIIARDKKKWFTWRVISIIAENKPHAHHKSHLHTMKVYNTRPSQFC